jgi:uncharacterized RDD family membrane protein YckC
LKGINKYAGFWPRLLAHNIDLLPILLLFYGVSFIIPSSDYDYLIISGIYFGYHTFFEASGMHATPGKRWAKIHVDSLKPDSPRFIQSLIRNTSKVLSLLLFFGGFVLIFFNSERRALHDYIGGTVVLFDED